MTVIAGNLAAILPDRPSANTHAAPVGIGAQQRIEAPELRGFVDEEQNARSRWMALLVEHRRADDGPLHRGQQAHVFGGNDDVDVAIFLAQDFKRKVRAAVFTETFTNRRNRKKARSIEYLPHD